MRADNDADRLRLALELLPVQVDAAPKCCGNCALWDVFGWDWRAQVAPCKAFPQRKTQPREHCGAHTYR